MSKILQIACFIVLAIGVAILVVSSLPTWFGGHLGGDRLLVHMMASGVVVMLLPLYGFLRWTSWFQAPARSTMVRVALWSLIVTGFLTIASMFACMLPVVSTATMRQLVDLHGWLGATMAVATILNLAVYWRKL